VAGHACQRPMMAHGHVSWPACAHTRTATPRWLSHLLPPRIGAVGRPLATSTPRAAHAVTASTFMPCPYPCIAATSGPFPSPPSQQPPSSHPTLLSSPFTSATAAPIADRASHHCCRRLRALELRHHAVSPSAREAASLRNRATNRSSHFILHMELAVDSHLRPSSGQATNSPSSAQVPRSSLTSEPATMATVPTSHRCSSPLQLLSPWGALLR
jgi:hypothetical protein